MSEYEEVWLLMQHHPLFMEFAKGLKSQSGVSEAVKSVGENCQSIIINIKVMKKPQCQ